MQTETKTPLIPSTPIKHAFGAENGQDGVEWLIAITARSDLFSRRHTVFLRMASNFQLDDRIKNVRRKERDEDHSDGLS